MKEYEYEINEGNLNLYRRQDQMGTDENAEEEIFGRRILVFISQAPYTGDLENSIAKALDEAMPDQTARTSYGFLEIGSKEKTTLDWGPGPNFR